MADHPDVVSHLSRMETARHGNQVCHDANVDSFESMGILSAIGHAEAYWKLLVGSTPQQRRELVLLHNLTRQCNNEDRDVVVYTDANLHRRFRNAFPLMDVAVVSEEAMKSPHDKHKCDLSPTAPRTRAHAPTATATMCSMSVRRGSPRPCRLTRRAARPGGACCSPPWRASPGSTRWRCSAPTPAAATPRPTSS